MFNAQNMYFMCGGEGPKVPAFTEFHLSNKKYEEHGFAQHAIITPLNPLLDKVSLYSTSLHNPHQTSVTSASTSLFFPLILLILQRNEFYHILTLHSSNRYRKSNIRTTHIRSVFSTGTEKYKTQKVLGAGRFIHGL